MSKYPDRRGYPCCIASRRAAHLELDTATRELNEDGTIMHDHNPRFTRREFMGMTGLGLAALAVPAIGAPQAGTKYPAGRLPYRPYTLSPYDKGWIIEDAWPTLFFGDEVVAEIRRKCDKLPWARKALGLMKREAALAMAKPPLLPVEPAGWRHDFYSRATAEHLLYDPAKPDEYLDPSTGKYEHDDAQRRAWVLLTHERTYRMMRSLGILYRVTGEDRYAAWAIEGLRKAADYFTHAEFARSGALYYQSLYDAAELSLVANTYGLVRKHPSLSAGDHKKIRENIFEKWIPGQVNFLNKHATGNMACYVAAALACCGSALERSDWVDLALGETTGLATLLTKCLRTDDAGKTDGFWFEGTMFYHYYSLCALVSLWESDKRHGGKVSKSADFQSRFAGMFAAPASLVDEKLRLPVIGDLGAPRVMNLAAYRHLYEYCAGKLDPKRFGPVLASIYAVSKAPRVDLAALAFGPDELPKTASVPKSHSVLRPTEIGVFRATTPHPMQLTFRCGHYSGGHDHPDRLQIALSAFGELISPDLGTPGYSLHGAVHNYFRTTLAHNTLFADELDQTGDATLEWQPTADPPQARGTIQGMDGVVYRRTVFFAAPYVVLLDEYESDAEHRFGWVYHAYGNLKLTSKLADNAKLSITPPLPDDKGFSMLTARSSGVCSEMLSADWRVTSAIGLQLLTASDGAFEVTTGKTPGQPWPDALGCVVLRAQGKRRRFATVLEPYKTKPTVTRISLSEDGSIIVQGATGTREFAGC